MLTHTDLATLCIYNHEHEIFQGFSANYHDKTVTIIIIRLLPRVCIYITSLLDYCRIRYDVYLLHAVQYPAALLSLLSYSSALRDSDDQSTQHNKCANKNAFVFISFVRQTPSNTSARIERRVPGQESRRDFRNLHLNLHDCLQWHFKAGRSGLLTEQTGVSCARPMLCLSLA